jgi:hypothetical protein
MRCESRARETTWLSRFSTTQEQDMIEWWGLLDGVADRDVLHTVPAYSTRLPQVPERPLLFERSWCSPPTKEWG